MTLLNFELLIQKCLFCSLKNVDFCLMGTCNITNAKANIVEFWAGILRLDICQSCDVDLNTLDA